jgi:hypothetical protein
MSETDKPSHKKQITAWTTKKLRYRKMSAGIDFPEWAREWIEKLKYSRIPEEKTSEPHQRFHFGSREHHPTAREP